MKDISDDLSLYKMSQYKRTSLIQVQGSTLMSQAKNTVLIRGISALVHRSKHNKGLCCRGSCYVLHLWKWPERQNESVSAARQTQKSILLINQSKWDYAATKLPTVHCVDTSIKGSVHPNYNETRILTYNLTIQRFGFNQVLWSVQQRWMEDCLLFHWNQH